MNLDYLEVLASLVHLVFLVLLAILALLVPKVKREAQASLDIRVSWVPMEPQDLVVRGVKVVNLEKAGKGGLLV